MRRALTLLIGAALFAAVASYFFWIEHLRGLEGW